MSIYVIDEIMGRGKTSAMINFINHLDKDQRVLFVAPYLSEVDRIIAACPDRGFLQPKVRGGKLQNAKKLFRAGANIVTTHVLFSMFNAEILKLIQDFQYILIMDEVASVVRNVDVSEKDATIINENFTDVGDGNQLIWTDGLYNGQLSSYKALIQTKDVRYYNECHWVELMKGELFLFFKDVYIMTYMFEHQLQRCYFDLKGIKYERKYVAGDSLETYHICDDPQPAQPVDYKSLVHILDNQKLNDIGRKRTALSKGWYQKNTGTPLMDQLRCHTYNYFHNIIGTESKDNMWTCFKKDKDTNVDWQRLLSGKGYTKGFVSCNSKGTNAHRERTTLAYLINCFPNSNVYNFFHKQGVAVNQNGYALSEMVQWIWRSAIRDGKEINIYIPSQRMRTLLINWLDDISKGG